MEYTLSAFALCFRNADGADTGVCLYEDAVL
jgi:hypothetical protein